MTTAPDRDSALAIARALLAAGHAACVNCLPGATSVYRWQGEVQTDEETVLLIKTTRAAAEKAAALVHNTHPYELPEMLAVPIIGGSPNYLDWLERAVGPDAP